MDDALAAVVGGVVSEPTVARYVGTKLLNHASSMNYSSASTLRGEEKEVEAAGLLVAKGSTWRTLRNTWQPAFSPAALSGYVPLMAASTERLIDRLHWIAAQKEGKPVNEAAIDMWRELGAMTLQVVGSTAYGVDFCAIEQVPDATLRPAPSASAPGMRLINACKVFFQTASIHTGSRWSRISMLLPELSPIWARLSHAFPDKPLLAQQDARKALLDTSKALIQGWRQHAEGADARGAHTCRK
ncbi:hypothetical protein DUNSADRAFT_6475 [Dunaliella salina]|uniref:Cytochrome P450 n=1 Tax=Dunaliella salina TaxID=3046 RepID=A0ABQ7GNG4_DUNSA|nr:hypothetical protein DUNSADRAFT_6475 [Dunaliella salina]|eukprot:KAF5836104.1 hypothetical protein DUNSADRAFT_6475 [Dunaliella salina]